MSWRRRWPNCSIAKWWLGLFQGRMEFGPRALGGRSILGDPRSEDMQRTMNLKIKFRESFRPFAPSVMREHVHEFFDVDEGQDSPYMLLVSGVADSKRRSDSVEKVKAARGLEKLYIPRSDIPAITHVDYSARIPDGRRTATRHLPQDR